MKTYPVENPNESWQGCIACCLTPLDLIGGMGYAVFLARLREEGFHCVIDFDGRGIAVITTNRIYVRGGSSIPGQVAREEANWAGRHAKILWDFCDQKCRAVMLHVPSMALYTDVLISEREVMGAPFTRMFGHPLPIGARGVFGVRNQCKRTSARDREAARSLVREWLADYQQRGKLLEGENLDGVIFVERDEREPWLISYEVTADCFTDYPYLDLYLRFRAMQKRGFTADIFFLPYGHGWLQRAGLA